MFGYLPEVGDRAEEGRPVQLEIGRQPIPGHQLTGKLGAGAFAEVWEAVCDDGRRVALKFLDTRGKGASLIGPEVRMLRGLSELRHPNVIHLHAVVACAHYLVLVMERATCNLHDLHEAYKLETAGNVPPEHALDLLDQAAEALDFLAGTRLPGATQGLQHCDVKPSNLLMVGPVLKIADFGLCAGSGWHTHQKGGWRGTPPYAAPELFNGAPTLGTDQYALAVTFCELVTGDRAFCAGTVGGPPESRPIDMTRLRESEFPVLSRALHPYPSSRWPNCKAFLQALRKAVESPRKSRTIRINSRGRSGQRRRPKF
jgi:serine/threonine protein kinase